MVNYGPELSLCYDIAVKLFDGITLFQDEQQIKCD